MKKKRADHFKVALAALLCAATLCSCSAGVREPSYSYSDEVKSAAAAPATEPAEEAEAETVAPSDPPGSMAPTGEPEEAQDPGEAKEPAMESVEGVARLGDMVGLWQADALKNDIGRKVLVDTESEHNPYDLTWRYGPDVDRLNDCMNDPEWDAVYRSYVEACDWSLVFDASYYKNAFPMLAKLYHDDDALLLEHFQTQGVHEGRQASLGFNVAAYMENCDDALADAFGDNYECYYFYYMLNYGTEKKVDAENTEFLYPKWLTVELSHQQRDEHVHVNAYRYEDGVDPVEVHPELVALANYRAWYDAEHNLYAHDYGTMDETREDVNDCFHRTALPTYSENTHKWYHVNLGGEYEGFYTKYRISESHNEAMTRATQKWSGYSNPYTSDNPENTGGSDKATGYCCQFDIYSPAEPKSPWDLY